MSPSRLAWLDSGRQLCLGDHLAQQAAAAASVPWGSWRTPDEDEMHSWPTWSPDGRRVATFRVARGRGEGCQVHVTEADGVAAAEVAELDGRLPIYLQWAPEGREVAVLTQSGEQLFLDAASIDELGPARTRLTGSPLFFEHHESQLVAFVGETDGPHLAVLDADDHRHDLPGPPGNFCAPVCMGSEVLYVTTQAQAPGATLVSAPIDGGAAQPLAPVRGLASMVGSPDGRRLAWSDDPDGTGKAYRGLRILSLDDGSDERISDRPLVAFLWCPDGDALVAAEQTDRGTLRWHHIGLDGFSRELVEMLPTRDLRFYIRFFEQFATSHRLIDPEGAHLVLAGGLVDQHDPAGTPRLWRVGLRDDTVRELTDGTFAVYAHPR